MVAALALVILMVGTVALFGSGGNGTEHQCGGCFQRFFYKYRHSGVVVYDGQLRWVNGKYVDTCFANEAGDLLFAYAGEMLTEAQETQFVNDDQFRFSLTFGPILVDGGQTTTIAMRGEPINNVEHGYQRAIGDIVYFATALPDGE